jgi:hypothetical protein
VSIRLNFLQRERLLATWRSPLSFTTLIPVLARTEAELAGLLGGMAGEFERVLPAVEDLHSFRLVVVPANAGGLRQVHVLMNLVHDRPLDDHLGALLAAAGPLLVRAFAFTGISHPAGLPALWKRHRVRQNTMHIGAVRRTLAEIRLDQALRDEIGHYADAQLAANRWPVNTPAETIRRDIRTHILHAARTRSLPTGPAPARSKLGKLLHSIDFLTTFGFPAMGTLSTDIGIAIDGIADRGRRELTRLAYRLWWIYAGIPTGLALAGVRWLELREPDLELPPAEPEKVERLESVEDRRLKNEVTYWFTLKESWARRQLMTVVLWGSEGGCRHLWTRGELSGIATIHFARLLQLADKRAMLFMSDYDGSLDRYLLDFTGVGSRAVIPISSNVKGCPKTRWLYGKEDPTTFAPRLRNLLRTYQLETSVWYNAYPTLTVRDVWVNARIRDGLFAPVMSEEDAQAWTDLL